MVSFIINQISNTTLIFILNFLGALLIDEIKLSEVVSFDKERLEFIGFTDLDSHTLEKDKSLRADHALVIMGNGCKP